MLYYFITLLHMISDQCEVQCEESQGGAIL